MCRWVRDVLGSLTVGPPARIELFGAVFVMRREGFAPCKAMCVCEWAFGPMLGQSISFQVSVMSFGIPISRLLLSSSFSASVFLETFQSVIYGNQPASCEDDCYESFHLLGGWPGGIGASGSPLWCSSYLTISISVVVPPVQRFLPALGSLVGSGHFDESSPT